MFSFVRYTAAGIVLLTLTGCVTSTAPNPQTATVTKDQATADAIWAQGIPVTEAEMDAARGGWVKPACAGGSAFDECLRSAGFRPLTEAEMMQVRGCGLRCDPYPHHPRTSWWSQHPMPIMRPFN